MTDHSSLSSPEAKEIEEIEIQSQQHMQVLSTNNTNNKSNLLTRPMGLRCSSKQKRTNHRKQYLPSWEDDPAAFYLSYSSDVLGNQRAKWICWLYKKK